MNVLLWILAILLGLYNLMGGFYMVGNYKKLAGDKISLLPKPVWQTLGVLQILAAATLIWPGATGVWTILIPIAAIYLAVETVWIATLQQTKLSNLLWAIVPGILLLFLAAGRFWFAPF